MLLVAETPSPARNSTPRYGQARGIYFNAVPESPAVPALASVSEKFKPVGETPQREHQAPMSPCSRSLAYASTPEGKFKPVCETPQRELLAPSPGWEPVASNAAASASRGKENSVGRKQSAVTRYAFDSEKKKIVLTHLAEGYEGAISQTAAAPAAILPFPETARCSRNSDGFSDVTVYGSRRRSSSGASSSYSDVPGSAGGGHSIQGYGRARDCSPAGVCLVHS